MKNLKKITAMILAVCMLIGMPLSMSVSATGYATDTDFKLLSAMITPESWGGGLNPDKQVALYFTGGPISINTSKIKAYIGIFEKTNWNLTGSVHAKQWGMSVAGELSQPTEWVNSLGSGNPNTWVFTMTGSGYNTSDVLPEYQTGFDSKLDTIPELLRLAQMAGKRLAVVLVDTAATANATTNVLESITSGTVSLKADANAGSSTTGNNNGKPANNNGPYDSAHAVIYDENTAARMTAAEFDKNTKKLTVRFSEGITYRSGDYKFLARVVNAQGAVMCYTAEKGFYTWASDSSNGNALLNGTVGKIEEMTQNTTEVTYTLTDALNTKIKNFLAMVSEHNATAAEADALRVVLVMEESNSNILTGRGDGKQNHYMDILWAADGRPVMANFGSVQTGIVDTMACDIAQVALTVETVDEAVADTATKLLVSVPSMVSVSGDKQLVVYKGETVVKINGEDAAWSLDYRSNEGKTGEYIAIVQEKHGCDKLSEIQAFLAQENIDYDVIDFVCEVSGAKTRQTITQTEKTSLRVLDIGLYAGQNNSRYAVITFSEDVDLDAFKATGDASKAYLVLKEPGVNDFYSGLADGAHGVRMPKDNMKYWGSSKNQIVCEFPTASWVDKIEQVVEESDGKAELAVRIESTGVTGGTAVPLGLVPLNADNVGLIGNEMMASGTRAWLPLTVEQEVSILSAKQTAKNQLVVTFSQAVNIDTDQPWIGLRMVNDKDQLVWLHRGTNGTPYDSTSSAKGLDMQWRATGWSFVEDDPDSADYHTQILVTFAENLDIAKLLDMDNFPLVKENPNKYEIKFGIEETVPTGERGNNRIGDITAIANPYNQLVATTKVSGAVNDGIYVSVTNLLTNTTQIAVSDAEITGENQVTVTFSHAVNILTGADQGKSVSAYFRYVNDNNILYGNATDGYVMVNAQLLYADDTKTKMYVNITRNSSHNLSDLDDLLNPTGELKAFMDANPGRWVLVLEEKTNVVKGQIDGFGGVDGHVIEATKLIPNWADGLYLELTGEVIKGELSATKCEIVGDNHVLVTFSAPIQIAKMADGTDAPVYATMRLYNANKKLLFWNPVTEEYTTQEVMYDKDGNRMYKGPNGYTTEKSGDNGKGEIVNYTAQSNDPMQWPTTWEWANKEHTQILYTVKSVKTHPANTLPDMLAYDWDQIIEGAFLGFDFEEKYADVKINNDWHVQNIVRADNPKIALDATFFPHNLDSVMWTLKEEMVWSYTPQNITASTEVLNDMQVRIRFSVPVDMEFLPYMGIRMIDKNGKLMWSGEENVSTPFTWSGSWEWEDESHRSGIWTMASNGILGGNTMYTLANWVGALQKYKDEGTWQFCIEEKSRDGFSYIGYNNRIDNISAKGTKSYMVGNYGAGTNGVLLKLNMSKLVGEQLMLLNAQATDDQTVKLTFSHPVQIDEGVSMGIRYLTPSGDTEALADGRSAYFKGDWEYADDTKTVINWKLNSKHAKDLTDIIQYNGNFKWNEGARVTFVIMDDEENRLPLTTMRVKGVQDLSGAQHLLGNYKTEDYVMSQLDIEVLYDLPSNEETVESMVEYVTNYTPVLIVLCATTGLSVIAAAILVVVRKKTR